MAYVPGSKHDLFLSYTHAEAAWAKEFQTLLEGLLHENLGRRVEFWKDAKNLRVGDNWVAKIPDAIEEAAAFLAVWSPIYDRSGECQKESVKAAWHRQNELFLNIVKTPSEDGLHNDFYPDLHRVEFFAGDLTPYPPGSKEFDTKVAEAARGIAQKLRRLRNSKVGVYVAQAVDDMAGERKQLADQLEADGYNVRTTSPTTAATRLEREIGDEKCQCAVFVLGATWDPYLRDQFDAAATAGKPVHVWFHPVKSGHAEGGLAPFIESLKAGASLARGSEILGGVNIREAIHQLQRILKPAREPVSLEAARTSKDKVFLLYDTKAPDETRVAKRLSAILGARDLAVFEPDAKHPGGVQQSCEELLALSDAALLYRGPEPRPDKWLLRSYPDVYFAEHLRASAFLLGNPAAFPEQDAHVIVADGEPTADTLRPFFDRLSQARSAHAGR